jgi:basic membrane protein A and related proteins
MSSDQLRPLVDDLRRGHLSRREFVRRAAVLGLSGPIIAAFLAACGGASPRPSAAATPAGSAGGKKLKVGLVTDVGSINDKSFNQSSWAGVQQAEKELGATIKFIETKDAKDYSQNIGQFVQEGYDAVVTVGFAIGEATVAAAKASPNVKFIGVDQFQEATIPNLAGLVFEEDKAGFLAGALAALVTKKKNIGGVFATDAVPPVWRFGEGYRAGAKWADPSVQVQIVYHNTVGLDKTFTDPAWGKASALAQIDRGADIIFGGGGNTGNGALFAVAERKDQGILCIGVDTDQFETVPESQPVILTSAIKLLTPGVFNLIKAVGDGTFKGGNVNGDVGLAPYHNQASRVTPDIQAKIDKLNADLKSGAVKTGVAPAKP